MTISEACCAHMRVRYKTVEQGSGCVSGHWECTDCFTEFMPIAIQPPASVNEGDLPDEVWIADDGDGGLVAEYVPLEPCAVKYTRANGKVEGERLNMYDNAWRIQAISEMGLTHRMENGFHHIEGVGFKYKHTNLMCALRRIGHALSDYFHASSTTSQPDPYKMPSGYVEMQTSADSGTSQPIKNTDFTDKTRNSQPDLKTLLSGITPENVHTEQEAWGTQPDVGVTPQQVLQCFESCEGDLDFGLYNARRLLEGK